MVVGSNTATTAQQGQQTANPLGGATQRTGGGPRGPGF